MSSRSGLEGSCTVLACWRYAPNVLSIGHAKRASPVASVHAASSWMHCRSLNSIHPSRRLQAMPQHTDIDLAALVPENCEDLDIKCQLSLRARSAGDAPEFWCYSEEKPVGQIPHQLASALSQELGCPAGTCSEAVPASVRIRSIQRDKESKRIIALKVCRM